MRPAHTVVAIAALLLTTAGPSAASPAADLDGTYVACMREAARTPDALEHWVDTCRRRATATVQTEAAYVTCLREAARTPDALEHWVVSCRNHANNATASPDD